MLLKSQAVIFAIPRPVFCRRVLVDRPGPPEETVSAVVDRVLVLGDALPVEAELETETREMITIATHV